MADLKAASEFLDQYAAAINAVVESVSGAVVRVQRHAEEGGGRHRWRMGRARTNHGSGVVIDAEKGYVLTSYHVASATIKKVGPDLAEHGVVRRPRLGIGGERERLYEGLAEHHKLDQAYGILIAEVAEGSAAAKGGIQPGDIIVTVDGQPVTGID